MAANDDDDGMILLSDEEVEDDSSMLSDDYGSSMDDDSDDDGTDDDGTDDDGGLDDGVDDDTFEDETMTPLVRAIKRKEPSDVIQGILRRSPELARQLVDHSFPLTFAISYGSPVDVVRALHGCWPEAVRISDLMGFVPLHCVGRETPVETVKFLVDVYPGALRRRHLGGGGLPIHYYVFSQMPRPEVVRVLVEGFPECLLVTNAVGRLPIHLAAVTGGEHQLDIIEFLADQRPETLLVATPCGKLPVHGALHSRKGVHVAVILRLTVEPMPEETRLSLMHFMVRELERIRLARSDDPDRIGFPAYLLKNAGVLAEALPETLRAKDSAGSLPIHVAVSQAHPSPELVQLLVDGWNGALDVRDAKGRVPLQLAHANPTSPLDVIYSLVRARPDLLRSGFS